MTRLGEPPLLAKLEGARRVMVAGAGGGFDVYAGLPLALALRGRGQEVVFGNLSFTYLGGTDAELVAPHLYRVTAATEGEAYCPERSLAQWLDGAGGGAVGGGAAEVWAFEKVGVQPMRAAYRALQERVGFDAIVLVDGGTDILMRGDEVGLGTPAEDMTSLAAVAGMPDVATRLVACIGFGIDTFHGVCHAQFLENVAALDADGAYLGAFSVPRTSPEGAAFLAAVAHAQAAHPHRPSIVNGSIAAAIAGQFGDVRFTERTAGSELFINPLMSLYFGFELGAVARRSLYLPLLENTRSVWDVVAQIEAFRGRTTVRPWRDIPH